MVRFRSLLVLVSALLPAAPLRAATHALERPGLHWVRDQGAEVCIDPRALAQHVAELTGRVLVEPSLADLSIEGLVRAPARGTFAVHLRATDRAGATRGVREVAFQGSDCRAFDRAIAFMIAVMIDPELALAELPASLVALGEGDHGPELLAELKAAPARPTEPDAPEQVAPEVAVDARPEPARARRAAELLLSASASGLDVPRVSLGATLGAALSLHPTFALELDARAQWVLGQVALDDVHRLRIVQLGGAVLACGRLPLPGVRFEGCAGPTLTVHSARGQNFTRDHRAWLSSVGAELSVGASKPITAAIALFARAGARLAVNAPDFVYAQSTSTQSALRIARVAPFVTIGAFCRF